MPGIYEVQVDTQTRVKALCDAQGWTVIQVGYTKPSLKIKSVNKAGCFEKMSQKFQLNWTTNRTNGSKNFLNKLNELKS